MNIREVLQRCHALAKDDSALAMDIRELIVWGLGSDGLAKHQRVTELSEEVASLKNTVRDLETENRDLRERIQRIQREVELRAS